MGGSSSVREPIHVDIYAGKRNLENRIVVPFPLTRISKVSFGFDAPSNDCEAPAR